MRLACTGFLLLVLALGPGCATTARNGAGHPLPGGPAPPVFQALYKVRAEGSGGRHLSRAWIAVDAPGNRISAEVLGPVGGTRAQFDADSLRVRAYLVRERALLDEPAGAGGMEAALGIPLEAGDLVHLLRGRRPAGGRTSPVQITGVDGSAWEVRWSFRGGPLPSNVTFQGPRGRLELEFQKLGPQAPPPEPFQAPAGARRVGPDSFRALLLP